MIWFIAIELVIMVAFFFALNNMINAAIEETAGKSVEKMIEKMGLVFSEISETPENTK